MQQGLQILIYIYCIYLQFVRSLSSIYKKKNLIRWWFLWIFNCSYLTVNLLNTIVSLTKMVVMALYAVNLLVAILGLFLPQTPNQHFFFAILTFWYRWLWLRFCEQFIQVPCRSTIGCRDCFHMFREFWLFLLNCWFVSYC